MAASQGLGYALLAEIADLDMNSKTSNVTKSPDNDDFSTSIDAPIPCFQAVINRVDLRLHLCADSLAAFSAFMSDLGSAIRPPVDERYVIGFIASRPLCSPKAN
jgi:autophagy-related protein 2